jgi:hypothetical protein
MNIKPGKSKFTVTGLLDNCALRASVLTCMVLFSAVIFPLFAQAQGDATANAKLDARQIVVGDQVRLFLEVRNNPSSGRVEWATIPDTFNTLEIVERGKIDTQKTGGFVTYKQRLVLTGFDSGVFKVPAFVFPGISNSGNSYTVQTDSFALLVQTVAVDTTRAFKPIKGIMQTEWTWLDYIWYIVGGVVLLIVIIAVIIYFVRRKKPEPVVPEGPKETIQEHTLRLLAELEAKSLWQKNQVKEYYVELTDIVRSYIEARFDTQALELTTDELLYKAQTHRELLPYHGILTTILTTADLAKFAKAQPTPLEHSDTMDKAKQLVVSSTPQIVVTPTDKV